jgi:hypothetical protein
MTAWQELDADEAQRVWDRFDSALHFQPSVDKADWPGIREPRDSVAFSIGHVFSGDESRYTRLTNDLAHKLIIALQKCVDVGSTIYALDWQHACYSFAPHQPFDFKTEDDWPVPPCPNGDYYIFLAQDMSFGVFGHPWEQTMCVFGRCLIDAFEDELPLLFDNRVRRGGE